MKSVVYARFRRLLEETVEMETVDGVLGHLGRKDIDDRKVLEPGDDDAIRAYFSKGDDLLVVDTTPGAPGPHVLARRSQFLIDPWLKRVSGYKRGQLCMMVVTDTNSKLYAFGDIHDNIEGRCDKHSIRSLLKDRKILPNRTPEGHKALTEHDLLSLSAEDDDFWCLYYPEYELNPGDTVLGSVAAFAYDREHDSRAVVLDVRDFLERLASDTRLVFPWLGLSAEATDSSQEADASPDEKTCLSAVPRPTHCRVLIVDDEVENTLNPMGRFLRTLGYEVVACSSAREADSAVTQLLDTSEGEVFDIALIDIHLTSAPRSKEYRGIRFAVWLQANMPRCAIVLMSAEGVHSVNGAKRAAAGDLQVIEYLTKPFSSFELRTLLRDLPDRSPVRADSLIVAVDESRSTREKSVPKRKRERFETMRSILDGLAEELKADKVVVFRMHKISRAVSILAENGPPFPRYSAFRHGLRYSPIRDVCEDDEAWCLNAVPSQWFQKHRNLLKIFDRSRQYASCVACPVPEPPGDDNLYGLFAFTFSGSDAKSSDGDFQPAKLAHGGLADPASQSLKDAMTLQTAREHAAYVAQHLLEVWHEATQIRQHPFLITGMATTSMGHDLANCLMGADHLLAGLSEGLGAGSIPTDKYREDFATLESLLSRAMSIANHYKKQARSGTEAASKFDLVDLILAICKAVSFQAVENKVSLYYFKEPRISLYCRRGVLERILFNIILNAVQQIGLSMRGTGAVQVRQFLRDGKSGRQAVIEVYDNGSGIQGYRQNRVFGPGETTRVDGSGMGLAICREEASRLDSSVHVRRSILFSGSCFEIVLPPKAYAGVSERGTKK